MNNIFDYAPKELVMDAFFAWIFKELNDEKLSAFKIEFFNNLRIQGFSKDSKVQKIQKQECNTDLIITIDGKDILFENKTNSTIHHDQLNTYKTSLPNCHQYIYMKLAFIDYKERLEAKKNNYEIVGIEDIEKALKPLKNCCQIVTQYYDFLDKKYIQKSQNIQKRIEINDATVYAYSDAQRIFISELYEKLDGKLEFLRFRYDANRGGTPWTQLSIAYTSDVYGKNGESIFWRIDKKKGKGYYIRLTQYANIDESYKIEKKERLKQSRIYFGELLKNELDLKVGKVSNRGIKSSEIVIFYFNENKYQNLSSKLVRLSIEFEKKYHSLCIN